MEDDYWEKDEDVERMRSGEMTNASVSTPTEHVLPTFRRHSYMKVSNEDQ